MEKLTDDEIGKITALLFHADLIALSKKFHRVMAPKSEGEVPMDSAMDDNALNDLTLEVIYAYRMWDQNESIIDKIMNLIRPHVRMAADIEIPVKKIIEKTRHDARWGTISDSSIEQIINYLHQEGHLRSSERESGEEPCRAALQNIMNAFETGAAKVDTDADETWASAMRVAEKALKS